MRFGTVLSQAWPGWVSLRFCLVSMFCVLVYTASVPYLTGKHIFPQTVWLTLGVRTVVVKGRGARSRCRTEFVAIFVLSCLHVHFSW